MSTNNSSIPQQLKQRWWWMSLFFPMRHNTEPQTLLFIFLKWILIIACVVAYVVVIAAFAKVIQDYNDMNKKRIVYTKRVNATFQDKECTPGTSDGFETYEVCTMKWSYNGKNYKDTFRGTPPSHIYINPTNPYHYSLSDSDFVSVKKINSYNKVFFRQTILLSIISICLPIVIVMTYMYIK